MELNYDKYIILASNNNLRCTYEAYLECKSGLSILQQLASTTNSTFKHRGEIILKPMKQQEAQKVSWPTKKDVLVGSAMVFVLASIAAVFFLLLDQCVEYCPLQICFSWQRIYVPISLIPFRINSTSF